jgi:hypothetical protein
MTITEDVDDTTRHDDSSSNLIRWNQRHEISKLELETTIDETRMKRIVVHGLKPEY